MSRKAAKQIKLTLVRSRNKRIERHQACLRGLGLRKLNHSVTVIDTPENRGMINKVAYMLRVEEV